MKRLLVYGFKPFGSLNKNPSQQIVERLSKVEGLQDIVCFHLFEVSFSKVRKDIQELFSKSRFSHSLGFGLWSGMPALRLERFALNEVDPEAADEHEEEIQSQWVVKNGPPAYCSTLDLRTLAQSLREAGVPCFVSHAPDN